MEKKDKKAKKAPPTQSESAANPSQMPPSDPTLDVTEKKRQLIGEEVLKPAKLPTNEANKPFMVASEKENVMVLNGLLVGSLTTEDACRDSIRNALRLARVGKYGSVLITGDLMYILTQNYGTQRPYKTQVSGVRIDPKAVQAGYPKSVVENPDFESVENRLRKGMTVFMTFKMRMDHTLKMLSDVFRDKDGKPLYDGSVYIDFGKHEDELINYFCTELLQIDKDEARGWTQKQLYMLTNEWRKERDPEKKKAVYTKIRDYRAYLRVLKMSNGVDESVDDKRQTVAGYLIRKYESCIPNSKVISVGDAHLRMGAKSIMVTTSKDGTTKGLTAKLAKMTESFSKGRMALDAIPHVMLGKGMNPYLDVKFFAFQASKVPGDKRMCMIVQLPTAIDSERYRKVIRNQNVLRDNITKMARTSGFESGVITLRWSQSLRQPILGFWGSEVLKNKDIFKDDKSIRAMIEGKKKEHLIIYGHKEGCSHYGANDVVLYDSPDDPAYRLRKYHHQVAKEFLLACDAPILMHQHDGDATQQMNHPYQKNVHLDYLLPEECQEKYFEIMRSNKSDLEKLKEGMALGLEQSVRRGVSDFRKQVEGYVKSLVPYLEYFVKILQRSKRVNLSFEGWFALILHIAGNHNKNTFKNMDIYVSDAEYINEMLKKVLLAYLIDTHRINLKDLVEKGLMSPRTGPLGEGRGTLKIDGKPCYTMELKHKQGSMDKTQVRAQRRGQEYYEVGNPIINLSGDDHRGGIRVTRGIVHIKTGCQQGEGSFGREIDFSEQNQFSAVYGIPEGGLANGPLVFMILDYETMRAYAKHPYPIDRNELFPNAVE
ncbi:MAG: hypothetical protein KGI60_04395 [Patescibacteria group bacterium]|nr:hypothetical protein [Patescibacteria group bacterium]